MVATATVTDAIREANRNFAKLFASRDALGIAQMYLTDAILLPPGADLIKGRDSILTFWRGAMETAMSAVRELALDTVDAETSGDLVVEVGTYKLLDESRQPAGDGKYMVVWKREQDTWRIYRDAWNGNQ
jgi:ketosteroid isomerase-like protein